MRKQVKSLLFLRECLLLAKVSLKSERVNLNLLKPMIERSYFMLDTELELVHFFKKSVDNKPYQTMSLNYGVLSDDLHLETDIIDEDTGQRQPGFKF